MTELKTLAKLLFRKAKGVRACFWQSESIMEVLAALGALAPYGPAIRPICLG